MNLLVQPLGPFFLGIEIEHANDRWYVATFSRMTTFNEGGADDESFSTFFARVFITFPYDCCAMLRNFSIRVGVDNASKFLGHSNNFGIEF